MDLQMNTLEAIRDPSTPPNLAHAIEQLNSRGLVQSAAWSAELLAALPAPKPSNDHPKHSFPSSPFQYYSPSDHHSSTAYLLAKSYFDSRQYRRAASTLEHINTPSAIFLRLYALYLAGERRKEEERQELADWTEPANLELDMIREELSKLRTLDKLDAHLWYLLGVVLKRLTLKDAAKLAFRNSINAFPYNWGAWLEVSPLCETWDEVVQLKVENHWMKTIFMAHFLNETVDPEQAKDIYEAMIAVLPKSRYLKGQLALALYNMRLFDEAQQLYDDLFEAYPTCLDGVDIYSNILYVKEDKVQLSVLANKCIKVDKYRLETCCVIGNYYSLRGQHEQAVGYFQRALKLNREYLSAWTLMGHEFLEMKNTAAAIEAYRRAVDINPKDFRAWYGLGQTYELLTMPLYTLYYYQKAAALRPRDARMWCAVGQTLQELHRWDEATRCYERAVGCDDREGLALAKLGYLYERMAREALKDGRQQERGAMYAERAAQYYASNLARRDEAKLAGQETADALKFLAEHTFGKGKHEEAEAYCKRLLDFAGHDKDFAKKLLRQIHSERENERCP